jgi:cysteine desulfurase
VELNNLKREIYLDNCATTKVYNEVAEIMSETMKENYGNPSSLHKKGFEAEQILKDTRITIGEKINSNSSEIFFTSGGTEANNIAISGYVLANRRNGNHVITTKIEHLSVLNVFKSLEEQGYEVTYLDVNKNGIIDIKGLKESLNSNTMLVSIMFVNNEVGSIQPIVEIGQIIKEYNSKIGFHVDGVQGFGKIDIDVKKSNIDMLSVSGHKIHGPKGIGFLYVKKGILIKPIVYGGGQELSLRSGTENVPGIAGLKKAIEITFNNIENNHKIMCEFKKFFLDKIKDEIKDVCINSSNEEYYSPYILNISFKGIKSEVLLHALESNAIYVSTGSACSSNKSSKSYVLQALGLNDMLIDGSIRISFSSFNTIDDISFCLDELKKHVTMLRKFIRR